MKILHIINAFYPCQVWGGPPQNTLILSKGLQSRGHAVHVLTTNILTYSERIRDHSFTGEWEGIPVTYLNAYWWGRRAGSLGFILAPDLWNYRHLIRNADIIHIHGYRHYFFVAVSLLALAYKVPFIVQSRGALTGRFGRVGLKKSFDRSIGRLLLSQAAGAVSLSDAETQDYRRLGVPPARLRKIMNAVDPTPSANLPDGCRFRRRYALGDQEKINLFLSRLHPKKGLDLLLEAAVLLDRPEFKYLIVGPDDGFLSTAQELVRFLNLQDRVLFIGPLYGQEKLEAYRAADVYVLPTRGGEGFPTTIIEACSAGTPVIVTDTTEAAAVVHDRIGIAVQYDPQELANALTRLLDQPDLSRYFRNQTKAVLQEFFSLDRALDQFEELYAFAAQKP